MPEGAKTDDDLNLSVPFRITIGVTGHRRIEDGELLRGTIGRVQADIARRCAGTRFDRIRFCVLSPLAEGADCIVAETILANDQFEDPTIKVLLPMSVADYRADFTSPASRRRFETLMAAAKITMSLRKRPFAEAYADIPPDDARMAAARRQAYEAVGQFVVNHCDVLIALWDGKPARGRGGTAGIVSYAVSVKCPVYVIDPHQPASFRIQTQNKNSAGFKGLDHCFESVEHFNHRFERLPATSEYVASLYRDLFERPGESPGAGIAPETKTAIRSRLMPYYALASGTAKSFQRIYRRVGLASFWLAFLAVLLIGVGAIFYHSAAVFFAGELGILLLISALILYADRFRRSHKHWMQYRFLTERIRAAFFLAACGLPLPPAHVTRRADGKPNPDVWMAMVFEEIWNQLPELEGISRDNFQALGQFIQTRWVDDQLEFHLDAAAKNQAASRRLETIGVLIYFVAIAAAALHLFLPFVFTGFHDRIFAHGLTLAALLLPALAATVEAIRSHREYKRIAIRSARIAAELRQLGRRFEVLTPATLARVVFDMSNLMRAETEEWLTMMAVDELHVVV